MYWKSYEIHFKGKEKILMNIAKTQHVKQKINYPKYNMMPISYFELARAIFIDKGAR